MKTTRIHEFDNNEDVIQFLRNFLTSKDVVLVKGSHGVRMDRIVSALEKSA